MYRRNGGPCPRPSERSFSLFRSSTYNPDKEVRSCRAPIPNTSRLFRAFGGFQHQEGSPKTTRCSLFSEVPPPQCLVSTGYGSKLSHQGTAYFSPCVSLPGLHFGYIFLTHNQLVWVGVLGCFGFSPGFCSKTPPPTCCARSVNMNDLVSDVEEVRRFFCGTGQVSICGHSMGAAVGLQRPSE